MLCCQHLDGGIWGVRPPKHRNTASCRANAKQDIKCRAKWNTKKYSLNFQLCLKTFQDQKLRGFCLKVWYYLCLLWPLTSTARAMHEQWLVLLKNIFVLFPLSCTITKFSVLLWKFQRSDRVFSAFHVAHAEYTRCEVTQGEDGGAFPFQVLNMQNVLFPGSKLL